MDDAAERENETAQPSRAVFECKPCEVSISETIADDPSDRTL
jgi:hypothetical protein